jgi:hypothetical protein
MLPKQSVDQIFARLLVRYGAAWIRMWDDIDMEAVKADWAEVLGNCSRESIHHALDHLPDGRPPNAMQFRDLCAAAPRKSADFDAFLDRLGVKPDPERLKRELSKLKTWRDDMARKLNDPAPDRVDYRRTEGFSGPFTPPPEHTLPPGMRKDAQ